MTKIIDTKLREKLGIDGRFPLPTTHFGWLLQLIREHGKQGLRYALGIKINGAIDCDLDGNFKHFSSDEFEAFRWLVIEVLSWGNSHTDNLLELMAGEFSWSARYVSDLLPSLAVSQEHPSPVPPSPIALNKRLAHDFGDAGLPYSIRFYTSPAHVGAVPPCQRCPHHFRIFVEEEIGTQATTVFTTPEFAPFAYLLASSKTSDDEDSILDMTAK
jgi:hypothetical protein